MYKKLKRRKKKKKSQTRHYLKNEDSCTTHTGRRKSDDCKPQKGEGGKRRQKLNKGQGILKTSKWHVWSSMVKSEFSSISNMRIKNWDHVLHVWYFSATSLKTSSIRSWSRKHQDASFFLHCSHFPSWNRRRPSVRPPSHVLCSIQGRVSPWAPK